MDQRPSTFILAVEQQHTWNNAHTQPPSTQKLDEYKQFQHSWAGYTVTLTLGQKNFIQKLTPSLLQA